MAAGLLFAISVIVVAASLGLSVFALAETGTPKERFERCYTTVNGRIAEGLFWVIHHTGKLARDRTLDRFAVLVLAVLFTADNLLVPVTAIFASQRGELARHSLAAAGAALIWACVLETTGLPERSRALVDRNLIDLSQWMWAVLLVIADVALGVLAQIHFGGIADAALAGAWFTALADLVSVGIGLVLCPWEPYPLYEPDAPHAD